MVGKTPNRRRFPRSPASAEVSLTPERGRVGVIRGKLTDISVTGARVVVPTSLAVGERLQVVIENQIQRVRISTGAEVRRVADLEDGSHELALILHQPIDQRQLQALRTK